MRSHVFNFIIAYAYNNMLKFGFVWLKLYLDKLSMLLSGNSKDIRSGSGKASKEKAGKGTQEEEKKRIPDEKAGRRSWQTTRAGH